MYLRYSHSTIALTESHDSNHSHYQTVAPFNRRKKKYALRQGVGIRFQRDRRLTKCCSPTTKDYSLLLLYPPFERGLSLFKNTHARTYAKYTHTAGVSWRRDATKHESIREDGQFD